MGFSPFALEVQLGPGLAGRMIFPLRPLIRTMSFLISPAGKTLPYISIQNIPVRGKYRNQQAEEPVYPVFWWHRLSFVCLFRPPVHLSLS